MQYYTMKFNEIPAEHSWKVDLLNNQHCKQRVINYFDKGDWYFRMRFLEIDNPTDFEKFLRSHDFIIEIEEEDLIKFDPQAKPKDVDFEILEVGDEG